MRTTYFLIWIHLIIFTYFLPHLLCLPNVIRVGGLFNVNEEEQELVFRFAIDRINADKTILPKTTLVAQVERIGKEDSFHADKKVCGLLKNGVVAIFGPISGSTTMHVQSICDALEIPHVELRWDFQAQRNDLSINLFPRPQVLSKAYIDLVKAWEWDNFAIVYEDNEGLIQLQDFLKEAQQREWTIRLYQFKAGKPYRDTFWTIKSSKELNLIIDVKKENLFKALKQAQQVGIMTEQHNFLITSLDLHTIDIEDFKFGKTKISSFRLVDTSNPELQSMMAEWSSSAARLGKKVGHMRPENIQTETALIYDGIKLLATALQDLDQSQSIDITSLSCENGIPWQHGSSLINYMRPITFGGITGLVGFDQTGFRSSVTLDVMTISQDGLQKIGTWSDNSDNSELERKTLNVSESLFTNYYTSHSLKNQTLIVSTIISPPYAMLRESPVKKTGNDQYEGYVIDLIHALSKMLHFKYQFKLVSDGKYGRPDKDENWDGMIGELINGVADIAIADLTITSKREKAVDFTYPFMSTGISILYKKPTTKATTLFAFLSPFENVVWIYVAAAYIGVSSILFVVGRISPYEWSDSNPCRQSEVEVENNFSLSNAYFFTIGSMMQQGSDFSPKSMSTRTIAAIWYFFTLIMISSYTANLAAFLTVERVLFPIENAEGLSMQEKIKYGCLATGSTASFFSDSNITTYKRMWDFMSRNPDMMKKSNKAGIEAVEQMDGNYAFMMESTSIEYTVERNCNLTQIGGLIDNKGYGIATNKDSKIRTPLSQALLHLQESGTLHTLKEKWWKMKKGGGKCPDDSKKGAVPVPLNLGNVGGVFVVLLGGMSLSFFIAICEFFWKARKAAFDDQDTMCEDIVQDLKFALSCKSTTKTLKKQKSTDSTTYYQDEKQYSGAKFSTIY